MNSTSVPDLTQNLISWRIQWPEDPALKQNFALPSCMLYYIAQNPLTPKCYSKMVQSCKYFFEKKPLLVVPYINSKTKICASYESYRIHHGCCMKIDHNKSILKMWLSNQVFLNEYVGKRFIALLCSRIYQCDILTLILRHQYVNYEDFKLLAGSAKCVELSDVRIRYKDGSNVLFETILESIPNIEVLKFWFDYHTAVASPYTFKNVTKLQNLGSLTYLRLFNVPEISSITDFILFSANFKNALIHVSFDCNISEAYKNQLDTLVDNLIESKTPRRFISYDGLDTEKFKTLTSLLLF